MNAPINNTPQITIFTSKGAALTKRFTQQTDGTIRKEALATLYAGTAAPITAPTATALAQILEDLQPLQAIATGQPKAGRVVQISTKAKQEAGQATRSLAHFSFPVAPGWLLWDYDDKTMPPEVVQRIAQLGGPLEAFFSLWPEARGASYVVRPSSSDGVTAPNCKAIDSAGLHGFFLVADASQAKATLEALEQRAWAAGLAWIALSKSGAALRRSIVDTSVGSPERLIFEAPPILVSPVTRNPRPTIIRDNGKALAAPSVPHDLLTAATQAESAARALIAPKAAKVEGDYINSRARDLSTRTGQAIDTALQTIRKMMRGAILDDSHTLQMQDGSWSRIGDLLDNPHNDRLSMPDPIEGLEYGADKATLMLKPRADHAADKPRLVSHAHGVRTVYTFTRHDTPPRRPQRITLPPAAKLESYRADNLQQKLRNAAPKDTLAVAVAVAQHLRFSAPVVRSVENVMTFLKLNTGDRLSQIELDTIESRVVWLQGKRHKAITDRTALPDRAYRWHHIRTVDCLSAIMPNQFKGVVLVKAPMGEGKTQSIGAPFVEHAKATGGGVVSIAHRISLISELSQRLSLPNYQTVKPGEIQGAGGLAVCLPSTVRADIAEAMPRPRFIFIDEIAQTLQFLAERLCAAGKADNADVYKHLEDMVRNAETVVGADADLDTRTLLFLEKCRPNERFTIIEVNPKPTGRTALFYPTSAQALEQIDIELLSGGKVWAAFESTHRAQAVADHFEAQSINVLCVTAATKDNAAQAAFLKDADAESRKYDLVISSPAISSGLSIEHKRAPHFTLGVYIGSGAATRPEDAKQQLGRVRYLRRFIVGIIRSNLSGGHRVESIRKGVEDAAAIEDTDLQWSDFDGFCASVQADAANARADFGAGLWWGLEAAGWEVERAEPVGDATAAIKVEKAMSAARREVVAQAIISAEPMDKHQASLMKNIARNEHQEARYTAHRIKETTGRDIITRADVDFWDGGRGLKTVARYCDLMGYAAPQRIEGKVLSQHGFSLARQRLYAVLLDGVDLTQPIDAQTSEKILDRIMRRPEAHAAVGIVGPKYRAVSGGEYGTVTRPKQAGREVAELMNRCGFEVNSKTVRIVTKHYPLVNKIDDFVTKTPPVYPRHRVATITQDSRDYMASLTRHVARVPQAAALTGSSETAAPMPESRHGNAGNVAPLRRPTAPTAGQAFPQSRKPTGKLPKTFLKAGNRAASGGDP